MAGPEAFAPAPSARARLSRAALHLAGIIARQAWGIPLVVTVHSLEPLRPWKREQLGGGYDATVWVERTTWPLGS